MFSAKAGGGCYCTGSTVTSSRERAVPRIESGSLATRLLLKAAVLAAGWAGAVRERGLAVVASMDADEKDKEIIFLRDRVNRLQDQVEILQAQLRKSSRRRRYALRERLLIICHLEFFQIPRRQVTRHFGVARSTLYRWLGRLDDVPRSPPAPTNKTPVDIASLVWDIARSNVRWGRVRISNQLGVLGVFLAASTVRNILNRPQPPTPHAAVFLLPAKATRAETRSIPAFYPNHSATFRCQISPEETSFLAVSSAHNKDNLSHEAAQQRLRRRYSGTLLHGHIAPDPTIGIRQHSNTAIRHPEQIDVPTDAGHWRAGSVGQ